MKDTMRKMKRQATDLYKKILYKYCKKIFAKDISDKESLFKIQKEFKSKVKAVVQVIRMHGC